MPITNIHILILAAGATHGPAAPGGGDYPACLTETGGVSLLERIVDNCRGFKNAKFSYAFLDNEVRKFHLDNVVNLLTPNAQVVGVQQGTQGSGCTALLAAAKMNPDEELLIVSANEYVDVVMLDIVQDFRNRSLDAGTLTFSSIHPRYSYVRLGTDGEVTEAAQQNPISRHATAGVFWFRRAGEFVEAVKSMIRKDASTNGAFYLAPAFNEMLLKHARVGASPIEASRYQPLKTEHQMAAFEHSHHGG
jgi:hypothetical protein